VAVDVSGNGNGHNGTLVGGAAFEASTGDGSPFTVRLDGVDDFIDLGPVDVNGTGLTLALWFHADTFPGRSKDPRLISKATGTSADDHVFMLGTIAVGTEVRLRARVRHEGATTTLVANSGSLLAGQWYHAAVTYDGANFRLYLDGVEVGSALFFGAVDIEPTVPVAVGGQPPGAGSRYFDGLLDDVRIQSHAMSPTEIAQIAAGIN
jgi:MSHA biogenesis protein MshQ